MFIIVRVREWMDFVRGILRQDHSNNICEVWSTKMYSMREDSFCFFNPVSRYYSKWELIEINVNFNRQPPK